MQVFPQKHPSIDKHILQYIADCTCYLLAANLICCFYLWILLLTGHQL